jgi:shikimate kinase
MNSVILIGFKSCGKTSVGTALATVMGLPFVDTDALMEQHHYQDLGVRLSNADIYRIHGKVYFRELEKRIVQQLDALQPRVIATGGGCILDTDNVGHLKTLGPLVYLNVSSQTIWARLQSQPMPALFATAFSEEQCIQLYEQRQPIYQRVADIDMPAEGKSVSTVVTELLAYCLTK